MEKWHKYSFVQDSEEVSTNVKMLTLAFIANTGGYFSVNLNFCFCHIFDVSEKHLEPA